MTFEKACAAVVPEIGKLYEFDITDPEGHYPARSAIGWWNGHWWITCFGLGSWLPRYVTGFRPYEAGHAVCDKCSMVQCQHCGTHGNPGDDHTCSCPNRDDECADHPQPVKENLV